MSTDTDGWSVLEDQQRFSKSVLYAIQKSYYDRKGPAAWHSGEVPHYATCNTYIAQSYADVTMAYLRELSANGKLDAKEPVYIVELAAGVGAFAAYFLHKLGELLRESSLHTLEVRYVMTDFTQTNLTVWSRHPHLRRFVEQGVLGFGTFDVDAHDRVELMSGGTLVPGGCKNPIVVFANYAFDTFRQDIFRVQEGKLHEVRVTTRAPGAGPVDLADPSLLAKLRTQYTHRPIDERSFYDVPAYNKLLATYRHVFAEATFTVPIAGLDALERLFALSGGRGMLLSSDKGFTQLDELFQANPEAMQLHTGCFSMMVNYHAVGECITHDGGVYASTTRLMNLKTAMCIKGGGRDDFADTLSMFRRRIEEFGPGDYFELFQKERDADKTIQQFLVLLRLSGHDPGVLLSHANQIRTKCKGLPEHLLVELRLALDRTWSQWYASPQNLPFELGRIMLALGRPVEGARFNQIAIEFFGEIPAALLNMGICYYYAEDPGQALRCFERAKQVNPDFGAPREWIARIHAERARATARVATPPPPSTATAPARDKAPSPPADGARVDA